MVSYMGLHQLDNAREVRERILDMQSVMIRLDIHTDLYFFQLFYLMQSKIYDLIKPAAQAALRFFRKNEDAQKVFAVEMPIALLLSKDHNYEDKKVRAILLAKCRHIVADFISKLRGAINFQEHYSRYMIWFEAIENGIPYHEAAREWFEEFRQ